MPSHNNSIASPARRKVLIIDDHWVVREGLIKCINGEKDLIVCGEALDATQALDAISRLKPDIVVMDLVLSSGHGLDLIKNIKSQRHSAPILVFTMFEESLYALRALQAGARGYIMKGEPSDRLLNAIRTILRGDYALSAQTSNRFLQTFLQPSSKRSYGSVERPGSRELAENLGDRELEVFGLIGKGLGTSEIASQLGCSVKTIETYRARIKKKLQLTSATALVREAVRWAETRRQVQKSSGLA